MSKMEMNAHPSDFPIVSVIIPAFNAAGTLRKCLKALLEQSVPPNQLEIIVVDDGSSDATADILREFPAVRSFSQRNQGPSVARNLGISKARGRFLAFTDSDCVPDPAWIERLLSHMSREEVISVGGSQGCPEDASCMMRTIHEILSLMGFAGGYTKSRRGVFVTKHNPSCNVLFRREVIEAIGGYRPGMYPGEDVDLDFRARQAFPSHQMLYDSSARVDHYRPETYGGWWRMMRSYGVSNAHNMLLHGVFRVTIAAPLFMPVILLMALHPTIRKWLLPATGAGCIVTAGTIGAFTATGFTGLPRKSALLAILVFGFHWGFWHTLLFGVRAGSPAAREQKEL